jgi:extradiol dioxygenase family protein
MNEQKETAIPFHFAFPVKNLEATKLFYNQLLGCPVGRVSGHWVDFNFFGHQISAHLDPEMTISNKKSKVDGSEVPLNHFGAVLEKKTWDQLYEKLLAAGIDFVQEPKIRYKGKTGEHGSMFIEDPSGNVLEFKYYKERGDIFRSNPSSSASKDSKSKKNSGY